MSSSQKATLIVVVIIFIGVLTLTKVDGDREHVDHGQGRPHSGLSRGPHEGLEEHYKGAEHAHNVEFDHEAILAEQSSEFDSLPPHEARKRLGNLLPSMDLNHDGLISKEELADWIQNNFRKEEELSARNKLVEVDADKDGRVTWAEYLRKIYGYTVQQMNKFENDTRPEIKSFLNMVHDDREKFNLADQDGDGFLSVLEYAAFLYPHSYECMHEHEVLRTLRDMDKDGDSLLSFNEYMGTSRPGQEQLLVDRENFDSHDTNHDGKLDKEEIKVWVVPDHRSIAYDEAEHLLHETDTNNDNILTFSEILDRYDLWVGSSATHYGESLQHEEL